MRPAYTVIVTLGFACRASIAASGNVTVGERDGNERVAKVVQPHPLAPLAVQPHLVSGVLHCPESVAPGCTAGPLQ